MKKTFASFLFFLILLPVSLASAKETLTIFIWSEYMDPEVIDGFKEASGAEVVLDYYESNEDMVAKLQRGGLGHYDIIVPSTYIMPVLKNLDLIQPLDKSQLPNIAHLSPIFTTYDADPGNVYTIPYQWGTSGLVIRSQNIDQVDKSWGLLFDPQKEAGSFVLFDTARDALGSALKYLGYSINSIDPQEIREAAALIAAAKKRPACLGFDNGVGGLNKVMGQIAQIAQVYNGEAMRAQEEDADVHYFVPKEGGEIWVDLMAIPRDAPQLGLAYQFMNYLMIPEVAAQLATYNHYATPNETAKQFIPASDLNNPGMYPDMELLDKMEFLQDLGRNNRLYDEAWTMLKN